MSANDAMNISILAFLLAASAGAVSASRRIFLTTLSIVLGFILALVLVGALR